MTRAIELIVLWYVAGGAVTTGTLLYLRAWAARRGKPSHRLTAREWAIVFAIWPLMLTAAIWMTGRAFRKAFRAA